MLNVSKLRRRPRAFGRVVGLSVEEFDQLVAAVRVCYPEHQRTRLSQRTRQRALGGGRRLSLELEERLLSTLLYYRLHLTGLLLSCLFELDESNLWRERNQRMVPVLLEVLPTPMQDHLLCALEDKPKGSGSGGGGSQRKRIGTLKELLEAYPELRDVCVDATEQQVPKPRDKKAKKQFYSGKSHGHTVKTQVTTAGRLVLHLMGGCPGNVADRLVLKASGVLRAVGSAASPLKRKVLRGKRPQAGAPVKARRVRLDRGYSGIEKEYGDVPGVKILAALKGTSRSKVTPLGRAWNQVMVSRQRIQVEQNIGHLKNWRVLSGCYRAQVRTHPQAVAVVAGLHNFTILGALTWNK